MSNQKIAYAYAISAVLFWSTIASAFKITLRYLTFLELLFYASLTSLVFFAFILIFQGRIGEIKDFRQNVFSAVLGFINPFLYYTILLKAYSILPAQEALALNYTWPIALTLMSIPILKQKIGLKNFLGLFTSFLGVLVISTHGDLTSLRFANPLGDALAISSSVIWASYWVLNLKDGRNISIKMFYNFFYGSIYTALALIVAGFSPPPLEGLLGGVYVGLFEMGLTFFLWLKALSYSKTTSHVANLVFLSPFLSLIFIHVVVGEEILESTLIGLILIIGGILLGKAK